MFGNTFSREFWIKSISDRSSSSSDNTVTDVIQVDNIQSLTQEKDKEDEEEQVGKNEVLEKDNDHDKNNNNNNDILHILIVLNGSSWMNKWEHMNACSLL